jgi:transcriptional regulator with XRE-family HTH domain
LTPKSLREYRRRLGYSQQQLGDGLGLSRSTIQKYESGRWPIPARVASFLLYLRLTGKPDDEQHEEEVPS